MHGIGIQTLSGVDLLGKPIFSFTERVTIPRGIAGAVTSPIVRLRLADVFPVFANLNDETSNPDFVLNVQDFIRNCSVIYNVSDYGGIDSGSLSIENRLNSIIPTVEDFVLQKNFSGAVPFDEFALAPRLFVIHHTVCDSSTASSTVTNFTVTVRGMGVYDGPAIKYL